MALNIYNIRKWYRMLTGKSVMHVNQDLGKAFDIYEIKGYYNNLTEKVTSLPEILKTEEMPQYITPSGKKVIFPVDVFQYGLGAYDMFLLTQNIQYKNKFIQCCEWAIKNQEDSGAWNTFFFKYPHAPYGGMSQGEGASLLIRGYKECGNPQYLKAAKNAIDFMLIDKKEGGCTEYPDNNSVILCEYTHLPIVLNGWIFAWFGLYDYVTITNDKDYYLQKLNSSEKTLANMIHLFSCPYWSLYDIKGKITSPFYHRLHIAQMQAMYALTTNNIYKRFSEKWTNELNNNIFKTIAFIRKAYQKIIEKEHWV